MERKLEKITAEFVKPSNCGYCDLDLILTYYFDNGTTHEDRANLNTSDYLAIVSAVKKKEKME